MMDADDKIDISKHTDSKILSTSLLAGAAAGLVVDVTLFPLDTVKTRLQSQFGFWKSGGFKGIYKGLGPVVVGSAPSAGAFFVSYNLIKDTLYPVIPQVLAPASHVVCASISEVVACTIKVPMEIVKQRRQAIEDAGHPIKILRKAIKREGLRGLYRGFGSTVVRDVPFSAIQFPVWEALKTQLRISKGSEISSAEVALCGALAGGIAGAATTPLDVAKTRIMLADSYSKKESLTITGVIKELYKTSGFRGLFAGFTPRTVLIFLGGGIFFGVYEKTARLIDSIKLE
ncbi:S-adenosylmethionine mitochondrial carrier protein [Nilaparvata lugens]|uniref:S-adenosylmethionine mitochondrial carrier protein n=1 Tax=Nilaparvata lugens TaxID=108931 RepID=UPI000B99A75E|nr:S-adenosylmethionine mitochondrial carrier protein [Nilaparvata lugens]